MFKYLPLGQTKVDFLSKVDNQGMLWILTSKFLIGVRPVRPALSGLGLVNFNWLVLVYPWEFGVISLSFCK